MQTDKSLLSGCLRTCLRLCQQQQSQRHQQRHILSTQLLTQNNVRAAASLAAITQQRAPHRVILQQHYIDKQYQQQPCNSINTSAPPLRWPKHIIDKPLKPLTPEHARELIYNLKDSERDALRNALSKYDAMMQKEGFEGTLAATRWRTRFGRPSKVPSLGDVDPTGTFCAFPDDWLKQKTAENSPPPSKGDLRRIFLVNAVPFIAFGFLDNFVMIVAGDSIENLFGAFMCISTMAAAGLGNTVSDVLGIGSAFYVERGCEMIGLRLPDLSPVQLEMKSSRQSANFGRLIGITIGCLLGMSPLLFMKKTNGNVRAQEAEAEAPNKETVVNTIPTSTKT